MQTRRYSSVLAVYHRVGGGRAIPATGTRTTGAVCAPACRGGWPIRGPLQPDTDRPISTFQSGPNRELIFRGCLPPYARARVGPTDPTYPKSVQAALQGAIQGGFTGTHTATRTAAHTATHTGAGTGERDQERGDGGSPREVQRCRRQRRKRLLEGVRPPFCRVGYDNPGVWRQHVVSDTTF